MKKLLVFVLVFTVALSAFGCSRPNEEGNVTSGSHEGDNTEPFKYVSMQEKSEWREPLIARIRALIASEDEHGPRNIGIGIIDVDLDGTPEVAYSTPGGTAGNTFFALYDLESGEMVGYFSPGWYGDKELGELALYLDTVVGRYTYVGICNYRCGWQEKYTEIYTISEGDGTLRYTQKSLFEEHFIYNDPGKSQTYAEHYIGDELVTYDDYMPKCEAFLQRLMKIEGSDFIHIEWDSLSGDGDAAEEMADALINSTQVFVKGDIIPEM